MPVGMGIHAQQDVFSDDEVFFRVPRITVFAIQLIRAAPSGGAMLLSRMPVALVQQITIHRQRVKDQHRQQKLRGSCAPSDGKRVVQQDSK